MKSFNYFLVLVSVFFVASTSRADNTINVVPFGYSFENFDVGETIIGTNGWYGDEDYYATVTDMTYTINSSYPIRGETHTKVVKLDTESGSITNIFEEYDASANLLVLDTTMLFTRWTDEILPNISDPELRFAAWLNETGQVVILHDYVVWDPYAEHLGIATVCSNMPPLGTDEWARVTVIFKDDSALMFQLRINEIIVTNDMAYDENWESPGTWHMSPVYSTGVGSKIHGVVLSGTGYFDDFVITNAMPAFGGEWIIYPSIVPKHAGTIEVSTNGVVIDPPDEVRVNNGDDVSIKVTANLFWNHINSDDNGDITDRDTNYTHTIMGIDQDHTFYANLKATMVTNGTQTDFFLPSWWLHQNAGITEPTGDSVLEDSDSDGFSNWYEWFTSTDPSDPDSFFRISDFYMTNGKAVVEWVSTSVDPSLPPFRIDRKTNLVYGGWEAVPYTNERENGVNIWQDNDLPEGLPAFYRIVATNALNP